jgi:hypothetical protein
MPMAALGSLLIFTVLLVAEAGKRQKYQYVFCPEYFSQPLFEG